MTPRNRRLPALCCIPAVLVSLGLSVPARAAGPQAGPAVAAISPAPAATPAATPAAPAAYDDEPAPTTPQAEVPAPRPTDTADAGPSAGSVELRAGKRVRTSGIVTLSLGTVMLGVGAGLEHKRRTDVCKEILSEDHGDACDRSKMANITVLAMGVTMLIGGAVLIGVGQSKINRTRKAMASRGLSVGPAVARGFAGATFTARF